MKTVPLSEARAKLSSLLDAVEGHDEEITITRNGRVAARSKGRARSTAWECDAIRPWPAQSEHEDDGMSALRDSDGEYGAISWSKWAA